MGQYAAFTTLRWALDRSLFPQCISVQSYIKAGSAATFCPALLARQLEPAIFLICTHILSLKNLALDSLPFHTLFHKV